MRRAAMLLALVALGCPRHRPPPAPDFDSTPHLPSPTAGSYGRSYQDPPDEVVASLVGELRWEASLSGAAGGLALAAAEGLGGLAGWEVREAAWRAGYPYPVAEVSGLTAARGSPPTGLPELLARIEPEDDVGLVRARAPSGDAWVLLLARPEASLGLIPRQLPLGAELALPPIPDARWQLADSDGALQEGSLDHGATWTLHLPGEWLVRVSKGDRTLALFPVYVGVAPPEDTLLDHSPHPVREPWEATSRAVEALATVRSAYDLPPWSRSERLDTAAALALANPDGDPGELVREQGYLAGDVVSWACEGATVEDCLDSLVWDPQERPLLLSPTLRHLGVAARLDQRVELLLILAGTTR